MDDSTKERIAERMKRLRRELGLTQAELAARAELPQSVVSRAESKSSTPGTSSLGKIAFALGVTVADMLAPLAQSADKRKQTPAWPLGAQLHVGVHSSLFGAPVALARHRGASLFSLAMREQNDEPARPPAASTMPVGVAYDADALADRLRRKRFDCIVAPRMSITRHDTPSCACATIIFPRPLCDVRMLELPAKRGGGTPAASGRKPGQGGSMDPGSVVFVAGSESEPFLAALPDRAKPAPRIWAETADKLPEKALERVKALDSAEGNRHMVLVGWEPWVSRAITRLEEYLEGPVRQEEYGGEALRVLRLSRTYFDIVASPESLFRMPRELLGFIELVAQSVADMNRHLCGRSFRDSITGKGAVLLPALSAEYDVDEQRVGSFLEGLDGDIECYLALAWLDYLRDVGGESK